MPVCNAFSCLEDSRRRKVKDTQTSVPLFFSLRSHLGVGWQGWVPLDVAPIVVQDVAAAVPVVAALLQLGQPCNQVLLIVMQLQVREHLVQVRVG